jgi:hypothetical protein
MTLKSALKAEHAPLIGMGQKTPSYVGESSHHTAATFLTTVGDSSQDGSPYPKRINVTGLTPARSFLSINEDDALLEQQSEGKHIWHRFDHGASQFGLRMAVVLTLSSLFVLIRTKDWHYPDGMWGK